MRRTGTVEAIGPIAVVGNRRQEPDIGELPAAAIRDNAPATVAEMPSAPPVGLAPDVRPEPPVAVRAPRWRRLLTLRTILMVAGVLVVVAGAGADVAARRALRLHRRRLRAGRQAVGVDRRVGDRLVGQRPRRPGRQGGRPPVSGRSAPVPDRARQRVGQPRADRADDRIHEGELQDAAERHRRAGGAGRRSTR